MSEVPATYDAPITPDVAEALVVDGDLSKLTPAQRTEYYVRVCKSLGLNPLTRPFQYIKLQGKLTLYATRDATDQIRNLRNISVRPVRREFVLDNSLYVVEVEAELPNGRKDFATAAVPVKGLQGDALANALMKAETKAKRRVTLSIAGLGMLDETEVETIPDAEPADGDAAFAPCSVEESAAPEPTLASDKQVRMIQMLAKKVGMSKEEYRNTLQEVYGVESSRNLTVEQAYEFIGYLQSLAEEREKEHSEAGTEHQADVSEEIKQQCTRLGFSTPEAIVIRSAINSAKVDPSTALRVLKEVNSKVDAIEGLRMIGVPSPFKMQQVSAAAGSEPA